MKVLLRIVIVFILGFSVIKSATITLADYDIYISGLTTINFLGLSTTVTNSEVLDVLVNTYAYRFTITDKEGTMWGSTYNDLYTDDSDYNRVAQHALPSEADFVPQKVIFVYTNVGRRPSYNAVTRNGYSSDDWTPFDGVQLHYIIYYSTADAKYMLM